MVTLSVTKFDRSNSPKEQQSSNIYDISVTEFVFILSVYKLIKEMQSENNPDIFFTF